MKRLRIVLLGFCLSFLAACASIVIVAPNGAQSPAPPPISVPVNIEVTKSVYDRSFVVTNGTTSINVSGFNTAIKTRNAEYGGSDDYPFAYSRQLHADCEREI